MPQDFLVLCTDRICTYRTQARIRKSIVKCSSLKDCYEIYQNLLARKSNYKKTNINYAIEIVKYRLVVLFVDWLEVELKNLDDEEKKRLILAQAIGACAKYLNSKEHFRFLIYKLTIVWHKNARNNLYVTSLLNELAQFLIKNDHRHQKMGNYVLNLYIYGDPFD